MRSKCLQRFAAGLDYMYPACELMTAACLQLFHEILAGGGKNKHKSELVKSELVKRQTQSWHSSPPPESWKCKRRRQFLYRLIGMSLTSGQVASPARSLQDTCALVNALSRELLQFTVPTAMSVCPRKTTYAERRSPGVSSPSHSGKPWLVLGRARGGDVNVPCTIGLQEPHMEHSTEDGLYTEAGAFLDSYSSHSTRFFTAAL